MKPPSPRLEAKLDTLKLNSLSAEEITAQAANFHKRWQKMEPERKRELVELITGRIVIGKGEITISLCYASSPKDMAKRSRRESFPLHEKLPRFSNRALGP